MIHNDSHISTLDFFRNRVKQCTFYCYYIFTSLRCCIREKYISLTCVQLSEVDTCCCASSFATRHLGEVSKVFCSQLVTVGENVKTDLLEMKTYGKRQTYMSVPFLFGKKISVKACSFQSLDCWE